MITAIITADNALYTRLSQRAMQRGETPRRATNVLEGYRLTMSEAVQVIIVDMSLHAADTLVETLHSRAATTNIPIYVIESGKRLPLELRRLCTDVLEADTL
jgi:ActR/RegA family two-component response regulator